MSELSLKLTKLQEQNTLIYKKYMYDNQKGTKETPASKHKDISKRTRYHSLSFTIRTRQIVSFLI